MGDACGLCSSVALCVANAYFQSKNIVNTHLFRYSAVRVDKSVRDIFLVRRPL